MEKKRATIVLTASVGLGLFAARLLGELIPDALAIGLCMGAACGLGGFVCGVFVAKDDRPESARRVSRGLDWIGRRVKNHQEDE